MQIPKIPSIPADIEISSFEFDYLEKISEPLFQLLNDKYPAANLLDSDHLLCFIIILCRYNNRYPKDITELIPAIKEVNIQKPNLN
mgnify:FL=1